MTDRARASGSGEAGSPLVAAVEMGYGHLRAAQALADAFGVEVTRADLPPFASPAGLLLWNLSRRIYEGISRGSQGGLLAPLWRPALERLTRIEPLDGRDLDRPTHAARHLALLADRGFGGGVSRRAEGDGVPLVATFFVPALTADRNGRGPTYCLVTDADLSRAWVPAEPAGSSIRYLAPTRRAKRRLEAYGVAPERATFTGFPLPGELLGGSGLGTLKRNLAARLERLDPSGRFRAENGREIEEHLAGAATGGAPGPLHVTYTVGGAGAQAELARRLLLGLRPLLQAGDLRLSLVAGVRADVAERFAEWTREAGLEGAPVEVVLEPSLGDYFRRFNRLLAETDLLWTKPSELSFFAALGLPLLVAPPMGSHERFNREWLLEHGAAHDQGEPEKAGERIRNLAADGSLAASAWAGFRRLPNDGLYRIVERVGAGVTARRRSAPASPGPAIRGECAP